MVGFYPISQNMGYIGRMVVRGMADLESLWGEIEEAVRNDSGVVFGNNSAHGGLKEEIRSLVVMSKILTNNANDAMKELAGSVAENAAFTLDDTSRLREGIYNASDALVRAIGAVMLGKQRGSEAANIARMNKAAREALAEVAGHLFDNQVTILNQVVGSSTRLERTGKSIQSTLSNQKSQIEKYSYGVELTAKQLESLANQFERTERNSISNLNERISSQTESAQSTAESNVAQVLGAMRFQVDAPDTKLALGNATEISLSRTQRAAAKIDDKLHTDLAGRVADRLHDAKEKVKDKLSSAGIKISNAKDDVKGFAVDSASSVKSKTKSLVSRLSDAEDIADSTTNKAGEEFVSTVSKTQALVKSRWSTTDSQLGSLVGALGRSQSDAQDIIVTTDSQSTNDVNAVSGENGRVLLKNAESMGELDNQLGRGNSGSDLLINKISAEITENTAGVASTLTGQLDGLGTVAGSMHSALSDARDGVAGDVRSRVDASASAVRAGLQQTANNIRVDAIDRTIRDERKRELQLADALRSGAVSLVRNARGVPSVGGVSVNPLLGSVGSMLAAADMEHSEALARVMKTQLQKSLMTPPRIQLPRTDDLWRVEERVNRTTEEYLREISGGVGKMENAENTARFLGSSIQDNMDKTSSASALLVDRFIQQLNHLPPGRELQTVPSDQLLSQLAKVLSGVISGQEKLAMGHLAPVDSTTRKMRDEELKIIERLKRLTNSFGQLVDSVGNNSIADHLRALVEEIPETYSIASEIESIKKSVGSEMSEFNALVQSNNRSLSQDLLQLPVIWQTAMQDVMNQFERETQRWMVQSSGLVKGTGHVGEDGDLTYFTAVTNLSDGFAEQQRRIREVVDQMGRSNVDRAREILDGVPSNLADLIISHSISPAVASTGNQVGELLHGLSGLSRSVVTSLANRAGDKGGESRFQLGLDDTKRLMQFGAILGLVDREAGRVEKGQGMTDIWRKDVRENVNKLSSIDTSNGMDGLFESVLAKVEREGDLLGKNMDEKAFDITTRLGAVKIATDQFLSLWREYARATDTSLAQIQLGDRELIKGLELQQVDGMEVVESSVSALRSNMTRVHDEIVSSDLKFDKFASEFNDAVSAMESEIREMHAKKDREMMSVTRQIESIVANLTQTDGKTIDSIQTILDNN
jgi:predicted  nucleic acid-binding Zn-ribbon protein